jgi:hypothetical protein
MSRACRTDKIDINACRILVVKYEVEIISETYAYIGG